MPNAFSAERHDSARVATAGAADGRAAPARLLSLDGRRDYGVAFASACGRPRTLTAADRGEVIYRTNCISCHNRDPNLPGPLGPAIAGASHR